MHQPESYSVAKNIQAAEIRYRSAASRIISHLYHRDAFFALQELDLVIPSKNTEQQSRSHGKHAWCEIHQIIADDQQSPYTAQVYSLEQHFTNQKDNCQHFIIHFSLIYNLNLTGK